MFERPHHRRIAQVLDALDEVRLGEAGCLFGGGTAMAMDRVSKAALWSRIRALRR